MSYTHRLGVVPVVTTVGGGRGEFGSSEIVVLMGVGDREQGLVRD